MKTIIISNHPLSLPSIKALIAQDLLEGIVTTSSSKDLLRQLKALSGAEGIPLLQLNPKKIDQQLSIFLKKLFQMISLDKFHYKLRLQKMGNCKQWYFGLIFIWMKRL